MLRLLALLAVVAVIAAVGFFGGLSQLAGIVRPAAAEQPSVAGQPQGDQTVQITEAELTQRLSQQLVGQPLGTTPLGPATLTRITTRLADGHLQADGDAKVASATVPVSLTATGTVQAGRAVVLVDDLRAAGISLPSGARASVQQTIQNQLDQEVERQQLRITSLTIANGKLILTGSHR